MKKSTIRYNILKQLSTSVANLAAGCRMGLVKDESQTHTITAKQHELAIRKHGTYKPRILKLHQHNDRWFMKILQQKCLQLNEYKDWRITVYSNYQRLKHEITKIHINQLMDDCEKVRSE